MKRSKINILLLLIITAVGCSTTRIDEEVNTAFTISGDESIVLLSNSYHTGNQTELDFMDCLNNSILKKQDTFEIIPTRQFQNLFYPWFEPSTAPQSIEDLPKILGNELIKEKLSVMKIKYLIKITGETKTNASSGALSCAAGPGGGGCFGFAWWDDTSAYNASVWDLSQETSVGNVSANVTGTSMIPAIIIPIPILARTQSNACDGLSDQIVNFFSG
ncbi:MAG: hypothetical protein MKZ82_00105 [Gammaproteobacteria bacterium]|jgi:hypothetical protein|nr:hypothetical protein [Gammaproteobacteria bacterium]|tara:strand:+ start:1290 stop:1943 length:654 start_codon:yes stop_codon:yes gene_type:complete